MSAPLSKSDPTNDWDRGGLPAWTYHNEELAEIEKDVLFRRHWQLACHQSDIPETGDFRCFDIVGERAIIIRGKDGQIRAFHNLCRHRGSRVLADQQGNCPKILVCPFHAWTYNLDGTLRAPARPRTLPPLDPVEHGLKPIESEIWMGFVFLRFLPGEQSSVAEIMAPHLEEVKGYQLPDMVPSYSKFWQHEMDVNWKAVRDVDNEGYHVPIAHPGLQDLYGDRYHDEPLVNGANRSFGIFNDRPARLWSVRHYKKILPEREALPKANRRAWLYLGLFPNTVIGLYPDSMIFYQEYPVSATKTIQRGGAYRYRDESRELRLARYLSTRIDRDTLDEDTQLIKWSCEAMESSAFDDIILSDLEYGVRNFHDRLRQVIPVTNHSRAPARGLVADTNSVMLQDA
ncbi:MAG: aromatic ring-hydroxylating dioxygenase subunit alpha [Pseudomonadota bacterium]